MRITWFRCFPDNFVFIGEQIFIIQICKKKERISFFVKKKKFTFEIKAAIKPQTVITNRFDLRAKFKNYFQPGGRGILSCSSILDNKFSKISEIATSRLCLPYENTKWKQIGVEMCTRIFVSWFLNKTSPVYKVFHGVTLCHITNSTRGAVWKRESWRESHGRCTQKMHFLKWARLFDATGISADLV